MVVLRNISQCWFIFKRRCPLTYVVMVVSKADEDESKEESDLVELAWESNVNVTETHDVVTGRLAEQ